MLLKGLGKWEGRNWQVNVMNLFFALLLDKGQMEKSEPAKQSFLARRTVLPQTFGKNTQYD